jgi:hypothetical protein
MVMTVTLINGTAPLPLRRRSMPHERSKRCMRGAQTAGLEREGEGTTSPPRCTGTVATTMNEVLLLLRVQGDGKALRDGPHVPSKGWASSQQRGGAGDQVHDDEHRRKIVLP